MTVMASLSKCGMAHPPRAKPPQRSSSGPPGPCITPSTETCVVVVSFIVAGSFLVSLVDVRLGRTDLIGHGTVRAGGSCCAFPEQGPHGGDVVLGYRRREHGRALLVAGAA